MTSGGLMQLVAYGAQDIYLTGSPQITLFKIVYRRHTNYARESIQQVFNGSADFGSRVTATISRNGDLINNIYLQATLPRVQVTSGSFRWIDDIGHHMIEESKVEIGGQEMDLQSGDWLQLNQELSLAPGKLEGYRKMIGNRPLTVNDMPNESSLQFLNTENKPETVVYVPLQFWFCKYVGLSLPLIALQYHEVKVSLRFRRSSELWISGSNETTPTLATDLSLGETSLWVDYIYLDTDERRRFAQVSHEYLIEQVQMPRDHSVSSTTSSTDANLQLQYNHPIKELVWVVQHDEIAEANQWSNYTTVKAEDDDVCRAPIDGANPVVHAKLQLNGANRFNVREGNYFNLVQPYQHHTNIPQSPGINVYSFAERPEEHQPSGSANFSRIDDATLVLRVAYDPAEGSDLETVQAKVRVYAINYNVLRIMSGMGGLAYSN